MRERVGENEREGEGMRENGRDESYYMKRITHKSHTNKGMFCWRSCTLNDTFFFHFLS